MNKPATDKERRERVAEVRGWSTRGFYEFTNDYISPADLAELLTIRSKAVQAREDEERDRRRHEELKRNIWKGMGPK